MPDLITNLLLNDRSFKQGLKQSGLEVDAFGRRVTGLGPGLESFRESINKTNLLLKGFGAVGTIGLLYNALQGIANYWKAMTDPIDEATISTQRFAAETGFVARNLIYLDNLNPFSRSAKDADAMLAAADAAQRKAVVERRALDDLQFRLALLQEEDDVTRKIMEADRERTTIRRTFEALGDKAPDNLREQVALYDRIVDANIEILETQRRRDDEARAMRAREQAAEAMARQADRQASIEEMVRRDDINLLRAQGRDAEAQRLTTELDYEKRIKDVLNDTSSGYTDEYRQRLAEQLAANRDALLALQGVKNVPPTLTVKSLTAPGSAAALGQIFSRGATREEFNNERLRRLAEEQAKEQKQHTRLLSAIAAKVGTTYA